METRKKKAFAIIMVMIMTICSTMTAFSAEFYNEIGAINEIEEGAFIAEGDEINNIDYYDDLSIKYIDYKGLSNCNDLKDGVGRYVVRSYADIYPDQTDINDRVIGYTVSILTKSSGYVTGISLTPVIGVKVDYDTNGGSEVDGDLINPEEQISDVFQLTDTIPTKEGYEFAGWYEDELLTQGPIEEVANDEDVIVYAKWTAIEYDVTFVNPGSAENMTYDVLDETVVLPANPTREGYKFDGWFEDSDYTGTKVTSFDAQEYLEDVTFYGKWTVVKNEVVDTSDNGNVYIYLIIMIISLSALALAYKKKTE